jgi:putative DNA primase/helicase
MGKAGLRHIYFGIHPTKAQGNQYQRAKRGQRDIAAISCLFSEFDAKDFGGDKAKALQHIESLLIPPSENIDSGRGYHCYWFLTQPFIIESNEDYERAQRAQYKWVEYTGGDGAAKDLNRVLRVPGTLNCKSHLGPDYPTVSVIKADFACTYSLETLEALLPLEAPQPAPARRATTAYTFTDELKQAANNLDRLGSWRCDDYNSWLEVGMALSELGPTGLQLWEDWSQRSPKHRPGECEPKWRSFAPSDGKTLASLTYWANQDDPRPMSSGNLALKPKPALRLVDPETGEIEEDVGDPPNLLSFEASDAGNAEAVIALHGHRFRWVKPWGWLHYTGNHWSTEGADATLWATVVDTLRARRAEAAAQSGDNQTYEAIIKCSKPNTARVRACIAQLENAAVLERQPADFDQRGELLNVANGVLDLRTGEIAGHSSGQYFTYCLSITYKEEADCSEWLDFLHEVVGGGREVIDYLQEAVGYSLTGDTREECLFYIHGPTRSGKGTFTEALMKLLPPPLAVEVDFNTFAAHRGNPDAQNFALAPLKPSRMVFASESGRYQALNEAKVKAMTGGNDIRCAFKGKDHFSYRPLFKIWLSSNERPKGDVEDDAIWYRLKVIEFPHSHAGKEDKTLKRRLQEPDALAGLLAWAVDGAKRWYGRKSGLVTPAAIQAATDASRDELDEVQQWLDECTEPTNGCFVTNAVIQASYDNWCAANGHKPKGARMLGRALSKKGHEDGKKVLTTGGPQARGWKNLRVTIPINDSDKW